MIDGVQGLETRDGGASATSPSEAIIDANHYVDPSADATAGADINRRRRFGPGVRARLSRRPGLLLSPLVLPMVAGLMVLVRNVFDVNSFVLPLPDDIVSALWDDMRDPNLRSHVKVTLLEVVLGFGIGASSGFVIGSLLARYRLIEDMFYPYIVALQTMPKVAIAPLLVVWMGFGMGSKVVVAALIAFFPLLVNVIVGLRSADSDHLELMNSLSASQWQVWRMIRLPAALPIVFAGLEVAIVLSMVGAIVGEFAGASEGLGYVIQQRNARLDAAGIYSVLVILAAMGCVLTYAIRFVGHRAVFWDRSRSHGSLDGA